MARMLSKIPLKTFLIVLFGISVVSFAFFGLYAVSVSSVSGKDHMNRERKQIDELQPVQQKLRKVITNIEQQQRNLSHWTLNKTSMKTPLAARLSNFNGTLDSSKLPHLNDHIHIFYYPWYKSKAIDGKYAHWNHEQLPHWKSDNQTRRRQYVPPDEIGANFYPKLGPYSSSDPRVIDAHMHQIRSTGVGVVSVSWYPPHYEQTKETPVDDLMMTLFDAAAKHGLKIAFHIEPYLNRNGQTLNSILKYIINKYGNHSAFYRTNFHGRQLPVYYIYDSYQIDHALWAEALKKEGKHSVRNSKYDGVFLGLLVEPKHLSHLISSGFDGFYTYFATNGFSYGSSWKNWRLLASKAENSNLVFVPSIGPGYQDTRVRPWNSQNTRLRLKGQYYQSSFYSALAVKPKFLSITSFNEWHEGTQVEPAVPKKTKDFIYTDYRPNGPDFYLNMTRQFVKEYTANMTKPLHHHDNAF